MRACMLAFFYSMQQTKITLAAWDVVKFANLAQNVLPFTHPSISHVHQETRNLAVWVLMCWVCQWVEGLGVKEPHSDSRQTKPPFTRDGAKFATRKGGMASMPSHTDVYTDHYSLRTYLACPPLGSVVDRGCSYQQLDKHVKFGLVYTSFFALIFRYSQQNKITTWKSPTKVSPQL